MNLLRCQGDDETSARLRDSPRVSALPTGRMHARITDQQRHLERLTRHFFSLSSCPRRQSGRVPFQYIPDTHLPSNQVCSLRFLLALTVFSSIHTFFFLVVGVSLLPHS